MAFRQSQATGVFIDLPMLLVVFFHQAAKAVVIVRVDAIKNQFIAYFIQQPSNEQHQRMKQQL